MSVGFAYAQPGTSDHIITDTSGITYTIQHNTENIFAVRNIVITGNKKTRESIILRELPFRAGDYVGSSDPSSPRS